MSARYELPPERLGRWLERWAGAHAPVRSSVYAPGRVSFTASDGATVTCLPVIPGLPAAELDGFAPEPLLAHVGRDRRVGVLLVRLGAHAAGIFEGARLVDSKVDRRLVHGRNRAGGQSQRRFERRRAGQARESLQAAADLAARLLLPEAPRLDAVVFGGDRGALAKVLADRRLQPLAERVVPLVLDVPEARHAVLERLSERFRATVVILRDPE